MDVPSIAFSCLAGLSSAAGVTSNIIILILAWKKKVFKDTGQARLFIVHSSIVDLLSSSLCLQRSIAFVDCTIFTSNINLCRVLANVNAVIISQLHNSFMLLAYNRFSIVTNPFHANVFFSKVTSCIFISCSWGFSVWFVFVAHISNHTTNFIESVGLCSFVPSKVLGISAFILRSLTISFALYCYIKMYRAIRRQKSRVHTNCNVKKWAPDQSGRKILFKNGNKATSSPRTRRHSCPVILLNGLPICSLKMEEVSRLSLKATRRRFKSDEMVNVDEDDALKSRCQMSGLRKTAECISPSSNENHIEKYLSVQSNEGNHIKEIDVEKLENIKQQNNEEQEERNRRFEAVSKPSLIKKEVRLDGTTAAMLVIIGYHLFTSLLGLVFPGVDLLTLTDSHTKLILTRGLLFVLSTNYFINFVILAVANNKFRLEVWKLFRGQ